MLIRLSLNWPFCFSLWPWQSPLSPSVTGPLACRSHTSTPPPGSGEISWWRWPPSPSCRTLLSAFPAPTLSSVNQRCSAAFPKQQPICVKSGHSPTAEWEFTAPASDSGPDLGQVSDSSWSSLSPGAPSLLPQILPSPFGLGGVWRKHTWFSLKGNSERWCLFLNLLSSFRIYQWIISHEIW